MSDMQIAINSYMYVCAVATQTQLEAFPRDIELQK